MSRSRSPEIGKGRSSPRSPVKRQRRLNGVDEIVLSPNAKGLTTGEISAHFAEIYGASVSKQAEVAYLGRLRALRSQERR